MQRESTSPVGHARSRRRRAVSRSRFREYRTLLRTALAEGYRVVSLERYLAGAGAGERVLILRHDVDQHPASALPMATVERDLGVTSTWYLRWRTADPDVIAALRATGGEIGLHYETLTRHVLARGLSHRTEVDRALTACRAQLRQETAAFADLFGPLHSVCAHGDTRVPWAANLRLLEGQDLAGYGVRFDANLSLRDRPPALWLTDRSGGIWSDAHEPLALLRRGVSPMQCLTHPNNWIADARLWIDRGLARMLPSGKPGARVRITRTRSDRPPAPA